MKKLTYLIISLSAVFMLVSCNSNEEAEIILPEERFEAYIELWQEYNFDEMYDMLSEETKATYSREEFVDRYQKIYQDLEVDELVIEYTLPEHPEPVDGEEIAYPTTFSFTVQQQSIVDEIKFTAEITMIERIIPVDDEETISDWDVEWHPGLIFPELANGGTITLVSTPTTRGEIFDRNGKSLAITDKVYGIGVDTGMFTDNREAEIEKLAKLLDMSVNAIDSILSEDWVADGMFVPLKTVPADDDDYIAELMAIPAVIAQSQTGRSYPYGEILAHLIGYVGQITEEELEQDEEGIYSQHDLIGKRGIEELFETRLRGEDGIRVIVENETSKVGIAEKPPVPGEDIHLTIDADLQKMIFQAYDGDAGTAAVLDPNSGETLALVSSPSFDPHDFTYGISQEKYNDLVENPDQPILNRFAATYSPGSAFKPITAMVGLNDGAITQEDRVEITGLTWSQDGWGNFKVRRVSESDGPVDLKDALVRSDNIYFAQKAVEIGGDNFTSGLEALGFGESGLNFVYPIHSSQVSNSGEFDHETLLADSGYGQGEVLLTALHLATAYTPILNDGTMIQPILETNQELGQSFADDLISASDAAYLRDALRQVVAGPRGTARKANIDAVALSGKTGTAELKQSSDDKHAQENGWFVAYPDSHDIIIAMMVENIKDRGGSGYVVEKLTSIYQDLYQ